MSRVRCIHLIAWMRPVKCIVCHCWWLQNIHQVQVNIWLCWLRAVLEVPARQAITKIPRSCTVKPAIFHNKRFLSAIQLLRRLLRNFKIRAQHKPAAAPLFEHLRLFFFFFIFTFRLNVYPTFPFTPSFSSPPSCLRMAFSGHIMGTSQSPALSWGNMDPFFQKAAGHIVLRPTSCHATLTTVGGQSSSASV